MGEQVKGVLAILLVGVLAYAVYTQASGLSLVPDFNIADPPPAPNLTALGDLNQIAHVRMVPILGGDGDYDMSGRNLFQYGKPKPPPPTPEELERRRKAEEARLKALEDEARKKAAADAERRRKEQERLAERAKEEAERLKQQRALQQEKIANQPPPKKPPPPITLRLVGWLGRPQARIAVLLKGEDIVLAKQGEVIDGKFKILSMGLESVVMGYVDPEFKDSTKKIQMGS